jgi:hypothetical protein
MPARMFDRRCRGYEDIGDLARLGAAWNQSFDGGWCSGDLNGDGKVNLGDLSILGANWNRLPTAPSPPEMTPIPEPTSMALLALAGMGIMGTRRRFQS